MNIKCPNCKYIGTHKKYIRGSFFIELLLWLVFFPIGILYTFYRVSGAYKGCPRCEFRNVIKNYSK